MRYLLIVTVLFTFTTTIYGQGFVTGKVTDSNTREPLPGVYVIHGENKAVITDQYGRYLISTDLPYVVLNFRFVGYGDAVSKVTVQKGDTTVVNIELKTELKEIGQIVISANRTDQKIAELSVSMDLIKALDFTRSHITDTKELINKTPGIEVLDGQASIRGGTGFSYGVGSRVLALIDGLPVLSPDAGSIKWQFLPLENISQVEIIKGASSVLYGSSALNGIINFRTAPAGKDPETMFYAEAGIFGRPKNEDWVWWNTPRVYSGISFSHLQKTGNNDIGIGLNLSDNNGYRKYNDEELARLSLRFKHYSEKMKGFTYGINVNSGYTEKTDFVLWENAETGALKQDTSSVSRLHGRFIALDPFVSFNNDGPFNHDFKFRLQSAVNKFPVRSENNSDAASLYGEYQGRYNLSDDFSIIAGFAGTWNRIIANFYGNHDGLNLAVFAQAEGSPLNRLKLTGGIRVESNSLDGIKDRLVPIFRAGFNWQVAEYTYVRGSFGQGYRYPSVAEKYASTTLGAVKIFPNPFISPETGWSSELGIKQGLVIGTFRGQADLAVFLSENENLIEYIFGYYPDEKSGLYDFGFRANNEEHSRISGIETEFLLNKSEGNFNVTISGGYTFINPVSLSPVPGENNYLKYRRKHSAKLSADAGYGNIHAGISIYYRSKILNIDDVFIDEDTREQILPGFYEYWNENNTGYLLLDGNIGYDLSSRYNISVAVKNITNTEYMGRPGDIQPHRNFSLRFTGKF